MTGKDSYEQAVINAMHHLGTLMPRHMEMLNKQYARFIILEGYRIQINQGLCTPIEKLTLEEKQGLWEEAKSIAENPIKRVAIAKAIHSLGNFIQL